MRTGEIKIVRLDLYGSPCIQKVSVGQRAAKLRAVKVGGLKKILPLGQSPTTHGWPRFQSWTI